MVSTDIEPCEQDGEASFRLVVGIERTEIGFDRGIDFGFGDPFSGDGGRFQQFLAKQAFGLVDREFFFDGFTLRANFRRDIHDAHHFGKAERFGFGW
jgi:hypothetical protein